ncbi:chloroplast envelope membrane protein [Amborella trichopoda]|uniref:chloroplast envelope membrane protein n=1 Tax=Amborella trichopoda TaxID=13333 RepID=UPI0009BCF4EC|nr:chloroplast envelope membrane protein [Amborella trichopoda]|eukprot:XP_020527102.1 chloroplast envelope membrane protein [Amborella trichopoda]
MFLMSNSMVICWTSVPFDEKFSRENSHRNYCSRLFWHSRASFYNKKTRGQKTVPNAKHRKTKTRTWWQKFFIDEEGNWFGLKDDIGEIEGQDGEKSDDEISEKEKFEAWKRRAEAISELREAQESVEHEENRDWEDWLLSSSSSSFKHGNWEDGLEDNNNGGADTLDSSDLVRQKGVAENIRDLVIGTDDDDDEILYEDRVFRYASRSSAVFLAVLVLVPCALDFVVHDYVLMPFVDRYVEKVPLAAALLDVRKSQKLEMIKTLKIEKARYRFEAEIGKSPPLSDEEIWFELRHKALELRDEWRLENRKAFANIWSDMVFGIALFVLIFFNQSKVALMKFTGYKIFKNVSDTGKAFLIILVTDIFLGYHSESGWQTLIEIILEHYGLEVDQSAITIFISVVPVVIDACVKLWLFKFLPKLSPKVSNIFREMRRH